MAKIQRKSGQRLQQWGLSGDAQRLIESKVEYPIMYRALGTPPQTQPDALRRTMEQTLQVVPPSPASWWTRAAPHGRPRPGHLAAIGVRLSASFGLGTARLRYLCSVQAVGGSLRATHLPNRK